MTSVVVSAAGGVPTVDIGGMQTLLNLSGIGFIVGGLVFGIALFRAKVLARWASLLLAISTVATASLAVLPRGVQPGRWRCLSGSHSSDSESPCGGTRKTFTAPVREDLYATGLSVR